MVIFLVHRELWSASARFCDKFPPWGFGNVFPNRWRRGAWMGDKQAGKHMTDFKSVKRNHFHLRTNKNKLLHHSVLCTDPNNTYDAVVAPIFHPFSYLQPLQETTNTPN